MKLSVQMLFAGANTQISNQFLMLNLYPANFHNSAEEVKHTKSGDFSPKMENESLTSKSKVILFPL